MTYYEPTQTDLGIAWCAGLFEGEGTFSTQKGKVRKSGDRPTHQRLSIGQCDPEVLERFVRNIGVEVTVRGPYPPGKNGRSERYSIACTGVKARLIMTRMWPYLGTVKRAQAIRAGFDVNF